MKEIIEFLGKAHIEYKQKAWCDSYFGPVFSIAGILLTFDFGNPGFSQKMMLFERYVQRKNSYVALKWRFGYGWSYRTMKAEDNLHYEEDEKRKLLAIEAFWKTKHS